MDSCLIYNVSLVTFTWDRTLVFVSTIASFFFLFHFIFGVEGFVVVVTDFFFHVGHSTIGCLYSISVETFVQFVSFFKVCIDKIKESSNHVCFYRPAVWRVEINYIP